MENKQLKALGKVAGGACEIVSGVLTFTGNGMAGKYLRDRNMMHGAHHYGAKEILQGKKTLEEGLRELKG